ncbi:protein kinase domain-containing protein [Chrysochromulina tobinii]|uniref:Protein kinase domain-containing protein n=1 Tax=Chrysochromulina tobinii TaxID=1460289 RepID=A0A0M0JBZ6_9EUKA|nr:protein kinase domain-containing protein [Chrysochromulina tobinii]|eukprot:KOO23743.1 protein kinase domain-containing protein [Chrysochromulina sp. CCMP291]
MTESVEPIELVLEFLAAKGFVNAEAALREQLELERTPLPVTEQGFSQLEAMLIRGATAGPAKSTGSILQEMRPPVLKAIVADEDMPQSPDTHAAAAAKPSAPAPAAAPVTIRWHDPDADGDVDAWTDDEALGYLQIECSEEALMRGFAASITSRDSFAAEELSAGRNPRDPIFEMYEYPTAADRAATALASASGAAATAPDPRVLCSSNGAGVKTGCAPSKAAEPAAATPAATPSTPSDAEATKARLRALHEQVMQMEAVVTAGQATRPHGDAAEVMGAAKPTAEGVPTTAPTADVLTTAPGNGGADATSAEEAKEKGVLDAKARLAALAEQSDPEVDPYEKATREAAKLATMSLKVVHERGRTGFEEHKDFQIRLHSLIAARYQVKEFLGSAAFSKAVQCLDLHTGEMVCVKIIKNNKDFFDQSLDEVMLLDYLKQHDPDDSHHVVHIYDFFYHKEHLFIVCELLRDNLYEFSKYNREQGGEPYFTLPRLRRIAKQCLEALDFVHKLNLIHCDLKPENILIKSYSRCEVKVIDFGSSCYLTDHLSSYVQSRSYRAPEVILGLQYDGKIDIWSLGAILAELLTGYVLFQNDSVASMLARISAIVGPFPEAFLAKGRHSHKYFVDGMVYERDRDEQPFLLRPKQTSLKHRCHTDDKLFLSFVGSLLRIDPEERPTAEQALQHPWLTTDPYGWPPPSTEETA